MTLALVVAVKNIKTVVVKRHKFVYQRKEIVLNNIKNKNIKMILRR